MGKRNRICCLMGLMMLVLIVLSACSEKRVAAVSTIEGVEHDETVQLVIETTKEAEGGDRTAVSDASGSSHVSENSESVVPEDDTEPVEYVPKSSQSENLDDFDIYGGFIGGSEIRLWLNDTASRYYGELIGEYQYVKYQVPITVTGRRDDGKVNLYAGDLNEYFSLTEVDGSVLCGVWTNGDNHIPCYLQRLDSGRQKVVKPDLRIPKALTALSGKWYGVGSVYFYSSSLTLTPFYENLVYINLEARSGANAGGLIGIARYENGTITYEEGGQVFQFLSNANGGIHLDTADYSELCGNGVTMMADYERREDGIKMPDKLDFLTDEENAALKKEMGDYFSDLLRVSQYADETTVAVNGVSGRMWLLNMRGYSSAAVVMSIGGAEGMLAAIPSYENNATKDYIILYFSNSDEYLEPPAAILEWIRDANWKLVQ